MRLTRPVLVPLLLLAGAVLLPQEPAWASCTDVAGPGAQWRRCLFDGNDLRGANLGGADLRDGSFKRAQLAEAELSGVQARRAKFVSADLQGTVFAGADLVQADFTSANLSQADLSRTNLRSARFYGANLREADLSGAIMDGADFLQANLSGATWVDGRTICAEGSIGQCHPSASPAPASSDAKVEG